MEGLIEERTVDHEAAIVEAAAKLRDDDVDVVDVVKLVPVSVDGELHQAGKVGQRIVPYVLGALLVTPLEGLWQMRTPGFELVI